MVKPMLACSFLYIPVALVGALLAIRENRPTEFAGLRTGLPPLEDFLPGAGTAMSPPLIFFWALVILIFLVMRRGSARLPILGLALLGAIAFIGALGEPAVWESLASITSQPLRAFIAVVLLFLPAGILGFGFLAWSAKNP